MAAVCSCLYSTTSPDKVYAGHYICEGNGRLLDESETPHLAAVYHQKSISADETILSALMDELNGDDIEASDDVPNDENAQFVNGKQVKYPNLNYSNTYSCVCVWKNSIKSEVRGITQWGVAGRMLEKYLSSFISTCLSSPFESWEDVLEVQNVIRSILTIFTTPVVTYNLISSYIKCATRLKSKPNYQKTQLDEANSQLDTRPCHRRHFLGNSSIKLSNNNGKINCFCWHPERLWLAESSTFDGTVKILNIFANATHLKNNNTLGCSAYILSPDLPSLSSLVSLASEGCARIPSYTKRRFLADIGSSDNERQSVRQSRASLPATSLRLSDSSCLTTPNNNDILAQRSQVPNNKRSSIGQMLRSSIGRLFPMTDDKDQPNSISLLHEALYNLLDSALNSSEVSRRNTGVQCISFKPMYYDTVLAVGYGDGFEIWRRSSDHQGPPDEGWCCDYWMTATAKKSRGAMSHIPVASIAKPATDKLVVQEYQSCFEGVVALEWSPCGRGLLVASKTTLYHWPYSILNTRIMQSMYNDTGCAPCYSPTCIPLKSIQFGGCDLREIVDVKWSHIQPLIAVLMSDGTLEILDTTCWSSRIWKLPVDRTTSVLPKVEWHPDLMILIVATEVALFQLSIISTTPHTASIFPRQSTQQQPPVYKTSNNLIPTTRNATRRDDLFGDSLNIPRGPVSSVRQRIVNSNTTGHVIDNSLDIQSVGYPEIPSPIGSWFIDNSQLTKQPVKPIEVFEPLPIHQSDMGHFPIRSFALDQTYGERLAVIYYATEYIYLYQYSALAPLPERRLLLIDRISAPDSSLLYPLAVHFSQKHNPRAPYNTTSNSSYNYNQQNQKSSSPAKLLLNCHTKPTTILAARWGIYISNETFSNSLPAEESFTRMAKAGANNLREILRRKATLLNKPQTISYYDFGSSSNTQCAARTPIWPCLTVTYPLWLGAEVNPTDIINSSNKDEIDSCIAKPLSVIDQKQDFHTPKGRAFMGIDSVNRNDEAVHVRNRNVLLF